VKIASEMT